MRTLLTLLVSLAATVAAADPLSAVSATPGASSLTVRSSAYGKILVDGRGFALYAFTKDARGKSACQGACARAWPPYIVKQCPVAGAGARASLTGTTRRGDGRIQVTYGGRPLYYYVGDKRAGQVLCQNVVEFGGTWLVVRGSGRLVR